DLLLVPARPAHLRGVRALARGRHHPPVDVEEVTVGVEAELRLDPRAAPGRHVLVPDRRRLDDVAVAVEHGKVLADAGGCHRDEVAYWLEPCQCRLRIRRDSNAARSRA